MVFNFLSTPILLFICLHAFFYLSYSDNDNLTCISCGSENHASITNLIPVDTNLIYSVDYDMGSQAKKISTNCQVLENYSIGFWYYNISATKNSFYLKIK